MEEIGNTEAIQREILDEARRTEERIGREADEEVARLAEQATTRARESAAAVLQAAETWIQRNRAETMARVPLEKIRYRTQLVDGRVRKALSEFMSGLPEARSIALVEGLLSPAKGQFSGKDARIRFKGFAKDRISTATKSALGLSSVIEAVEDGKLPAPGVVVASGDGKITLRATLDLVESELLDSRRGELAQALCAEALKE